jgi:hypothetical protein
MKLSKFLFFLIELKFNLNQYLKFILKKVSELQIRHLDGARIT